MKEAPGEDDHRLTLAQRQGPALRTALLHWFDREKRDLPWRRTRDAYCIWLSEVMLQQTQVATVLPYYARFLERFPTVHALAEASEEDVLAAWKGLGYYSRARNLHRCAKEISARGGAFPRRAEALRELPGFGRYTAGAVASIAFGEPAALVDGNVMRVLARLFLVEGDASDRGREKLIWGLAERLVAGQRPGDWNQALMELGARICRPENPACLLCPVRGDCGALASGRVHELPAPKVRAPRKSLALALGVWQRADAVLLGRRRGKGLFGGLWELPAVDWMGGAELAPRFQALLGVPLTVGPSLGTVKRTLTHRDLTLHLFPVSPRSSRAQPMTDSYTELRFASAAEREALGISTAMQKALALLPATGATAAPTEDGRLEGASVVTRTSLGKRSAERRTKVG